MFVCVQTLDINVRTYTHKTIYIYILKSRPHAVGKKTYCSLACNPKISQSLFWYFLNVRAIRLSTSMRVFKIYFIVGSKLKANIVQLYGQRS